MRLKKVHGFTILELIVAMAIIGVLMLVAIPSFNSYIEQAKELKYEANAKSVHFALETFMLENPDFEQNYENYTVSEYFNGADWGVEGSWQGLTYMKPEYLDKYIGNDIEFTHSEMAVMKDGLVRVEYTGIRNNEDYLFEVQIGGSNHNRASGKEYGRYYYFKK